MTFYYFELFYFFLSDMTILFTSIYKWIHQLKRNWNSCHSSFRFFYLSTRVFPPVFYPTWLIPHMHARPHNTHVQGKYRGYQTYDVESKSTSYAHEPTPTPRQLLFLVRSITMIYILSQNPNFLNIVKVTKVKKLNYIKGLNLKLLCYDLLQKSILNCTDKLLSKIQITRNSKFYMKTTF